MNTIPSSAERLLHTFTFISCHLDYLQLLSFWGGFQVQRPKLVCAEYNCLFFLTENKYLITSISTWLFIHFRFQFKIALINFKNLLCTCFLLVDFTSWTLYPFLNLIRKCILSPWLTPLIFSFPLQALWKGVKTEGGMGKKSSRACTVMNCIYKQLARQLIDCLNAQTHFLFSRHNFKNWSLLLNFVGCLLLCKLIWRTV